MRYRGKAAIVTGATSGIGLATARRLAAEGARVAVISRRQEATEEVASELRRLSGGADAIGIACDVADEDQVLGAVERTATRFKRLDLIVNNAGMMLFKPLQEFTTADWLKVLGVDLLGAVHFTKQAFLNMAHGGSIVNVASVHALHTSPLVAPYAAAKAAVLSLTRSASIEGKERGIRANAVLPGAIDTPMLWDNPNIKSGAEQIDEADVGKAEDIAAAVSFLGSDDARFITGQTLLADGGRLARL